MLDRIDITARDKYLPPDRDDVSPTVLELEDVIVANHGLVDEREDDDQGTNLGVMDATKCYPTFMGCSAWPPAEDLLSRIDFLAFHPRLMSSCAARIAYDRHMCQWWHWANEARELQRRQLNNDARREARKVRNHKAHCRN